MGNDKINIQIWIFYGLTNSIMRNMISIQGKEGSCMDIFRLKELKKEAGMTNAEIAELSGIPLSTVNKIFSGATQNPRYSTLLAMEEVLVTKKKIPFMYNNSTESSMLLREENVAYQYSARKYDTEDIERLDEGDRAELIDGKLYMLSAPSRKHQFLVSELLFHIKYHIRSKRGGCHAYTSPFDVRLFQDERTIVQPDVFVICNRDILTDKGCTGAPDWIIEVISENNSSHDYVRKLMQYQKAGVREYWIVDPHQNKVTVLNFENPNRSNEYGFEDGIPSGILEGLEIRISDLLSNY